MMPPVQAVHEEVYVETKHQREARTWAAVFRDVGIFLACVFFCLLACWLVFSKQDSKLYEADNVVCASQPLAITCFERKPR